MTTIATDGKTIACDGQADIGDTIVASNRVKIRKLGDGSLFGFSGRSVDADTLASWIEGGGKVPKLGECQALLLKPNRELVYYNELGQGSVLDAPAAVGSGQDSALGAMEAGATPEQAILIAASRDPFTGGKITVLAL